MAIIGVLSRPELPPKITGRGRAVSVLPLDVLQLDDALPAGDLALDELAHLLGAGGRRHAAQVGEALPHLQLLENRAYFAVQALDCRALRRRRDGEAQP